MEIDSFKMALMFIIFGTPIAFGILAGLGCLLGSKVPTSSIWMRRLAGAVQVLSIVGIPFMLMLFQHVSLVTEAAIFVVWIVAVGASMRILRNSVRESHATA